jgi:L,D-transpeptidase ErfK/SrfK
MNETTMDHPLTRRRFGALALALACSGLTTRLAGGAEGAGDDLVGAIRFHTTRYEDTLLDIARANRLGLIELMAANRGIDPWLPGENQRLVLPTAHLLPDAPRRGIIVNIAELRLYYFPGEDKPVISLPIGVGRDGFKTPLGGTKIVRKKEGPAWRPTKNARREDPELPAVVPAGPDNPLGDYALYLGWPLYLIHGTNKPWGIGRRVSRGCIRLYPEDIEWLFKKAGVGTPVTVVDQPIKLGRYRGDLYIEVHPSKQQVDQLEQDGIDEPDPPALLDDPDQIIWAAGADTRRLNWTMIKWALQRREGLPYRITQ